MTYELSLVRFIGNLILSHQTPNYLIYKNCNNYFDRVIHFNYIFKLKQYKVL